MAVRANERRPRALPESAPRARQAHETGICAVREELYAQCFEEVRTPRHVRARALPWRLSHAAGLARAAKASRASCMGDMELALPPIGRPSAGGSARR